MSENDRYKANAGEINRQYMNDILIEQRLIDSDIADTTLELFGKNYASPVMMPAFSHIKVLGEGRETGMIEYAKAAKQSNLVNWVGVCENDHFQQILDTGADTVRIIKPYADKEKVYNQIQYAQEHGAVAVGMDIDHAFGYDGKYDVIDGEQMVPQSFEDIADYVSSTNLPFIVKGVLSVQDAVKCAQSGVYGIVVSQHHGRMPYAVPTLKILPKIVEALGMDRKMKIFVDGGIAIGADVFKCLALGADAVSVGSAMLPALTRDGTAGVCDYVDKMTKDLAFIMSFTGFQKIAEIESSVLWMK